MKYTNSSLESNGAAIVLLIIAFAISFGLAAIGCWLWGVIMVGIFGLPVLTYWQFFGLMWLLHILLPGGGVRSSGKKD